MTSRLNWGWHVADDIARLGELVADLTRRIAALETAPRAKYTTVRAGALAFRGLNAEQAAIQINGSATGLDSAFVIFTEDGNIRCYFGTLNDGAIATVKLDNPDKSGNVMSWQSDRGILGPYFVGPWTKNPTQPIDSVGTAATTSTTAQVGYRTLLFVSSDVAVIQYWVQLGAGVSAAQVQTLCTVYYDDRAGYAPSASSAIATRNVTSSNVYTDEVTIPTSIWTPAASPVGSLVQLELTARVTGGAGQVSWGPVLPVQLK